MKKYLVLIVIILLLTGNALFWASKKEGFHVDEMFSYEQVGNTQYPKPYYDRPDEPCLNTWHSRAYYEDYLTVSSDESFDISAFYESACKNGAHPPLYLLFLGMEISAVSPNHFTKWSGIVLNIAFYIIALLIFYGLAKRILKKEKLALLSVFLSGACVGIVSIVVFIRPYMLLTVFTLAFADFQVRMLERKQEMERSARKRVITYIGLALLFIGGALSQYYFLVFAFFLCFGYWLVLLITRERRLLLEYTLVMAGSFCIYLYIWPNALRDLLLEERGVEAINNFMGAEQRYAEEVTHYFRAIDKQTTGGFFILFFSFIVIAILVRVVKRHSPNLQFNGEDGVYIRYSGTKMDTLPTAEKNRTIPVEWVMVVLLAFSVICFVMLIARIAPTLPGEPYKTTRYIACIYPFTIITLVFLVDKVFMKIYTDRVWRISIWPLLVLMVFAGYFTSGVGYLYPGTLEQLDRLSAFSEKRAVLVTERSYHSSNLNVYFTEHKAVYQTDCAGLATLSSAFSDGNDDVIVFYISEETENAHDVLEIVMQELGASGCSYLFLTTGSNKADVYLISR